LAVVIGERADDGRGRATQEPRLIGARTRQHVLAGVACVFRDCTVRVVGQSEREQHSGGSVLENLVGAAEGGFLGVSTSTPAAWTFIRTCYGRVPKPVAFRGQ
jgi:hypothetical protein